MIHICYAVLEQADLESGLEEIFAGVPYAVFCRDAAYINILGVEQFKDFPKRLSGIVGAFESGILLDGLVAAFVECEFFSSIWAQVFMYLTSSVAGYAMWRPYSALSSEGRVVCRMVVSDEKDREGVEDLMVFSSLALGLTVNELQCLADCIFRILTCKTSVNEVIKHINHYQCTVFHNLNSLISFTILFMMPIFRL